MTTFLLGWICSFVAFCIVSGIVYGHVQKEKRNEFTTKEVWIIIGGWLLAGMIIATLAYK